MQKKQLILRPNLNNLGIFQKLIPMKSAEFQNLISLHDVEPRERVRVQRLSGQPALCRRLREMGFCEQAEVEILNKGGAMLCQVCNSKVCLSRKLAELIMVKKSSENLAL